MPKDFCMNFPNNFSNLLNDTDQCITTIDSHTEGETTRLIVSGLDTIKGKTMMDKLKYFKARYDDVRCLLTKEPRGSREVLAALVTESVREKSAFGLIYMDAKRYPYLCGHATIGAVTTLVRTGFLKLREGKNSVFIDTPSGNVQARVFVSKKNWPDSVAINMVPSFVYDTGKRIEIKGFGVVNIDIVCTGGFFAMVDSKQIGIEPILENKNKLIPLGMKIIEEANKQITISHPSGSGINTIDVTEFYESHNDGNSGRGMVIYGESHADRSPCGTGTAAKLTLLHHYGKIKINQKYTNYGPLDTSFEAMIIKKEKIHSVDGFIVQIKGTAYLTGIHHFILENNDPFQRGFII